MSATPEIVRLPPLADTQFDIGPDEDPLPRFTALYARHGDIYRFHSPARGEMWVINHPDDVKRVLVANHRNYVKGLGLDRVRILLGNGIMTSEGDLWKRQRYMMQPAFHRRLITGFAQLIDACNERCIARWEALASRGELINITDGTSELALEIVLHSIFGTDLERLSAGLGENPFAIVARESARDLRFAYRFRQLSRLVGTLITRRREERSEHFDFLAMLMGAADKDTGAPMSDTQMIDEVMTLIVAGHETTASALNSTWYLLARNPQAESRLHAEVDAAPERAAHGLADLEALSYTRNVVDEALRLYPPGWCLTRRTLGPDTLSGYPVPPDTNVLMCLYLLHRHPRYWHEPEAFRPERFDAAHESERPRFAYMPFAAGPRHCIGETLALYEMYMHLYKVARRYRLIYESDRPLELEAQINLRSRYPLMMKLERRR
jgi:cytochrome P450